MSEDDTPPPAPPLSPSQETDGTPSLPERIRRFWSRHRTAFWMVHSGWALTTGIVVVYLARERYGFVPWVVAFLALTWASTMFFGRRAKDPSPPEAGSEGARAPGVGEEVTSYVTRTLYQETLFFLLPLYAHSTVPASPNVVFLLLLAGLALVSCLDLLFDRWLRTHPAFGLVFFATVAFAAVNLLLPLLFGTDPGTATRIAAVVAVASAVPLALRVPEATPWARVRLGLAAAAVLVIGFGVRSAVPPVPLRLKSATFAPGIDRGTLAVSDTLEAEVSQADLDDALYVVVRVFAPAAVPTGVGLAWKRDGEQFRTSREVEIVAHRGGFRVWDGWGPERGPVPPGRYRVVLRTDDDRVFGTATLRVTGPPAPAADPG